MYLKLNIIRTTIEIIKLVEYRVVMKLKFLTRNLLIPKTIRHIIKDIIIPPDPETKYDVKSVTL